MQYVHWEGLTKERGPNRARWKRVDLRVVRFGGGGGGGGGLRWGRVQQIKNCPSHNEFVSLTVLVKLVFRV